MSINKNFVKSISKVILTDTASEMKLLPCLRSFIQHQISTWEELNRAAKNFKNTVTRQVFLKHLNVTLQHNAERIRSSSSNVDRKTIENRPCFLCPENLYPKQKALLYLHNWLILCNPFPIFNNHLVVSRKDHCVQTFFSAVDTMTAFVEDSGFAFSAFYNGPEAGASAPDHLHFQVCPAGNIPVERQVADLIKTGSSLLKPIKNNASEFFTELDNRTMFICLSEKPDIINEFIKKTGIFVNNLNQHRDEPSLNIIVSGYKKIFTAIVFPRKTHRPACYYAEADRQIMVSPGAVDVGGLIIMPRKKDFLNIEPATLLDIYKQVCADSTCLSISEFR